MTGTRLLLAALLVGACAVVRSTVVTEDDAMMYLERFGYMTSANNTEEREKAICDFQMMASITQTCMLDQATMEMMNLPRCGMPDNIGHKMDAKRRKRYTLFGRRWSRNDLTYRIDNTTPDLSPQDVYQTMADALKVWSDVSPLTFTRVTGNTPADIIIIFASGLHDDGPQNAFDGPSNVLAHAFSPENGDAHFDEAETWTVRTSRGINLFQVAAHEFGHSLGLGHSDISGALMAAFYRGYVPNFQLHSDDIAGIQAIYGADSGGPDVTMAPNPVPPSIPCTGQVDAVVTSQDLSTYIFEGSFVWKFDRRSSRISDGFPRPIASTFPGLPNNIDAGVYQPDEKKIFFFKGNQYWSYTGVVMDAGFPRNIAADWGGLPGNVDAAFIWSGFGNRYVFFFIGTQYYRYDVNTDSIASFYPRPARVWNIPGNRITAAVQWINRRTYFFTSAGYYRFDDNTFRPEANYPRNVGSIWQGCTTNLIAGESNSTEATTPYSGVSGLVPSLLAVAIPLLVGAFHL